VRTNEIFRAQQPTVGLDLGDRISHYCILDLTGNVILEQRVPTTPKGIQQVFSKISRSRIALETGTHSPWLRRLLTQLGHEVIVAHARNVHLIAESSRKYGKRRSEGRQVAHREFNPENYPVEGIPTGPRVEP